MKKFFSLIAAVLFAGSMMATEVTISPSDFTETTSADYSTVKEGVTVAVTASTVTSDQIRIFKSQTITISAESNISSIEFTCTANGTAKYGPGCFNAQEGYTYEASGKKGTWTGSATSVTFTAESNQVRATQIVVTLDGGVTPPAVAKPIIAGEEKFYDEVEVSITCATDGAAIRYTLDGTDPTVASALYEEPFTLSESATVKAIAILGSDASAIAEKAFVKNPSFASFEALIVAGVEDKTMIEVSFEGIEITHFYESTYNNVTSRKGVYFDVNEVEYEIYNSFAVISDEWEVGGKLSGTLRGEWQHYVNTSKGIDIWEVVPKANGWSWDELTYEAPSATAIDNTNAAVKAVKVVRDGVLYIEKNGVLYNAQGAIVR